MMYHCLFEQSGTFKKEFNNLGYKAEDYDILNDFNQTDHVIDLYEQINLAYDGKPSLFDRFNKDNDFLIAFFPCIRFENQILLHFRGDGKQYKTKSLKEKLLLDLSLQEELTNNYYLITKLVIICLDRGLKLIIENPFSTQHYLHTHWAVKPAFIDMNRRERGDYMEKPTQFFFINCEPRNNFIFEARAVHPKKISNKMQTVERSIISPQYANRFIREFILDQEESK